MTTTESSAPRDDEPTISVWALNALGYCERLYYLEHGEGIQIADHAIYQGRTLHLEIEREEGDLVERFTLDSKGLGLSGALDALRRRDGRWIPHEHKKGRSARDAKKKPEPWPDDRLQIAAYAMLLEEQVGEPVTEGRIRYHQDGFTVRVPIDDAARDDVRRAVARARQLRATVERPPVTSNERLCIKCSLAPVCLPEEERLSHDPEWSPVKLSVDDDERAVMHVLTYGQRVGRSGDELVFTPREGEPTKMPVQTVQHVVLHGGAQITSQAIHMCVEHDIHVSWVTGGGRWIGTVASTGHHVQRRVRQYKALSDPATCLALARTLVVGKVEGQLRFVLRSTRGEDEGDRRAKVERAVEGMRRCLKNASHAESTETLLGFEGEAASHYFDAWDALLGDEVDARLRFVGRTRRPPKDRVSALLGFGYALLLNEVVASLRSVGLEPALGFYHRPRSSAPPLALDLMELFRVPLVDMAVVASINRGQWDPSADFVETGSKVWLSEAGRRKFIDVFERRKGEAWKHSVVGYSLSYGRMIELEAWLLEKEWTGSPGLFARFRLR